VDHVHGQKKSYIYIYIYIYIYQYISMFYVSLFICLILWWNFRPHYNLNLQSIAVNGQLLPIDSGVFATTNNRGTIVDTGTTLAYLVQEAYNPFVDAVSLLLLKICGTTVCCGQFLWFYHPNVLEYIKSDMARHPNITNGNVTGRSFCLNQKIRLFIWGCPPFSIGP